MSVPLRADEIQIGSGNSTTYDSPINTYYNYSLTEMIYTAAAIENAGGSAGTISSISFEAVLTNDKNFSVEVFMKHVSRSSFSQSSDFESLTEATKVYTGTMRLTQGWVTLELDTPFEYDGTSNLLIAFDNNTGSNIGNSHSFKYTTASENRLWKTQTDSQYSNPDPLNYSGYGSVSETLPNLKLEIATTPVACAKPKNLTASSVTARSASLDWTKGSDDQDTWEIYLTQNTTDVPTEETVATYDENVTKPFALSNLTPESNYYAYVRANCGSEDGKSKWSSVCSFTTLASCVVPTNLTSSQITSENAILSWTAGSGQDAWEIYLTTTASDVPTAATQATHPNVTSNPYTLANLTPQTKYYAYVRANCGDYDGKSQWSNMTSFYTPQIPVVINAENPTFEDGFEGECAWHLVNGDRPNQWCNGSSTNNGGTKSMYITNDNGENNAYTASYQSKSMVYATKNFTFDGIYTFSFDWKCNGSYSDYFRVALVPASVELNAGTAVPHYTFGTSGLPQDWIALDGGSKLNPGNPVDSWGNHTAYEIALHGSYMMVFAWLNTSTFGANNPPAAIDNVSISYITCPRPTNLTSSNVAARTAIVIWKENGTADGWTLQYATDAGFSTDFVEEVHDGFTVSGDNVGYGLTGLNGDTKYYVRVKSNCNSDWSDGINFTTTATCEKPTLSYVSNSNTAHTGSVSWTGEAESYEVAYRPTSDFNPADETLEDVTRVTRVNVNEYTLEDLNPETKYYIYIQANCGEEDGKSQWSNRVIFTTLATCLAPSSLTKEATTSNSVTLSWTKGADDQDAWQFRYKKKSESEYSYKLIKNLTEPNYTLDGLEPSTEYNVNVRAWCDENDQSKWSYANQNHDLTITTDCADLTIPYFNNFEGAVEASQSSNYPMPKCWTRIAYQGGSWGNYSYYPYVFTATSSQPYNHGETSTSGHSMRFYRTSTSQKEAAVLPILDEQYELKDLQIRFWARLESYNTNKDLAIGVMTDPNDINTFEAITPFVTVKDDIFREYTVTFENYTGEGRYIAITYNTTSTYNNIYVDDVTVEFIPSCRIPQDLEATVDSDSQATLAWAPGKNETDWHLQYKKASESEWSSITVSGAPTYVLTNLKRATVYEARVQAICTSDDQSDWSETISFTTDCGIWPIDGSNALFENFDDDDTYAFPPKCWAKYPAYNGWSVNFNNAMVNDQPTPHGAAHSGTQTSTNTYLVLPPLHINGNATLSFDQMFGSTGDYATSSIVVSTEELSSVVYWNEVTATLWTADANNLPTIRTNEAVSLADYDGQTIYIAFKYEGQNTSGRTWYIDNVRVYVGELFNREITAYNENDSYYLIASPIGTVSPENVTNMLENSYDLYYFDQSQDKEWINYKGDQALNQEGHFSIEPGKGYLYANSNNVTLTFTGTPYNGDGKVTLAKTDNVDWSGWNLVGNPFGQTAYITKAFYTMNEAGSEVISGTGNSVEAMEGIFVIANTDGEEMTFSASRTEGQNQQLVVNVTQNSGASTLRQAQGSAAIDRAIIRFGETNVLPKFQLNPSHTKVYIPHDGKDYAIVRSSAQGELPLNFKAEKNGTYTLSFSNEEVTFNYLHLIDNLTGADVDLLAGTSTLQQVQGSATYTFEAKTADYASRFRLVFNSSNANEAVCEPSFAYFNGSNWTISNMGEATLQVIDVMGRVLSNETISGNTEININQPAGVYMLRLVSGDNVKVQKVVVR